MVVVVVVVVMVVVIRVVSRFFVRLRVVEPNRDLLLLDVLDATILDLRVYREKAFLGRGRCRR